MKRVLSLLFVSFFCVSYSIEVKACKHTLRLDSNVSLESQLTKENCTYIIQDFFDLGGKTISLPKGVR